MAHDCLQVSGFQLKLDTRHLLIRFSTFSLGKVMYYMRFQHIQNISFSIRSKLTIHFMQENSKQYSLENRSEGPQPVRRQSIHVVEKLRQVSAVVSKNADYICSSVRFLLS